MNKELSLQEGLKELEILRLNLYKKAQIRKSLFFVLASLCIVKAYYDIFEVGEIEGESLVAFGLFVALLFGIVLFTRSHQYIGKSQVNKLKSFAKLKLIRPALKRIDNGLEYKPIFKTHKKELLNSGLFEGLSEYKEDDCVICEKGAFYIRFSELHARRGLKSIFDGVFVKIYIPQEFEKAQMNLEFMNQLKGVVKEEDIYITDNRVYLKFSIKHKLFDVSLHKTNDETIKRDLDFIEDILTKVNKVVQLYAKSELELCV